MHIYEDVLSELTIELTRDSIIKLMKGAKVQSRFEDQEGEKSVITIYCSEPSTTEMLQHVYTEWD